MMIKETVEEGGVQLKLSDYVQCNNEEMCTSNFNETKLKIYQ